MTLDLDDTALGGTALTPLFLRFELGALLARRGLLVPPDMPAWHAWRARVRGGGRLAGPLHVHNHVIAPLAPCLGYAVPVRQSPVQTREGAEDGGWLMVAPDGA